MLYGNRNPFAYARSKDYTLCNSLRIQVPSEKVFGVGLEGPSTF